MARVARRTRLEAFALWTVLYQALILLVPAVILASAVDWSAGAIALAGVAGGSEALGTLAYGRALQRGDVGIAASLLSLEGAVAAALAFATGETLTLLGAAGLMLATAGGLTVGRPRPGAWLTGGNAYALAAALCFGIALWIIGTSDSETLAILVIVNGVAALVLAVGPHARAALTSAPRSAHPFLLASAVLGAGGFVCFTLGARASSVAVTAVLGAQFALFALLGGHFLFGERLTARQAGGIALLVSGVAVVTATTA